MIIFIHSDRQFATSDILGSDSTFFQSGFVQKHVPILLPYVPSRIRRTLFDAKKPFHDFYYNNHENQKYVFLLYEKFTHAVTFERIRSRTYFTTTNHAPGNTRRALSAGENRFSTECSDWEQFSLYRPIFPILAVILGPLDSGTCSNRTAHVPSSNRRVLSNGENPFSIACSVDEKSPVYLENVAE